MGDGVVAFAPACAFHSAVADMKFVWALKAGGVEFVAALRRWLERAPSQPSQLYMDNCTGAGCGGGAACAGNPAGPPRGHPMDEYDEGAKLSPWLFLGIFVVALAGALACLVMSPRSPSPRAGDFGAKKDTGWAKKSDNPLYATASNVGG